MLIERYTSFTLSRQYCGELASYGIIVAAVEHRDGSGVSSIVRSEEAPQHAQDLAGGHANTSLFGHKGSRQAKASVPYFPFEKIGLHSFSENPSDKEMQLRQDQLAMRRAEIEECLHIMRRINAGEGAEVSARSTRGLGRKLGGKRNSSGGPADSLELHPERLAGWKGRMDTDYPCLVGHSFGGATVLEMLRMPEPSFPYAIVLDPWMEPVRDPTKVEEVKGKLKAPIYVLNSESFTIWEEHFDKLKRVCHDARATNAEHRGWLM